MATRSPQYRTVSTVQIHNCVVVCSTFGCKRVGCCPLHSIVSYKKGRRAPTHCTSLRIVTYLTDLLLMHLSKWHQSTIRLTWVPQSPRGFPRGEVGLRFCPRLSVTTVHCFAGAVTNYQVYTVCFSRKNPDGLTLFLKTV